MMYRSFAKKYYDSPGEYSPRQDAPPLISSGDTDVVRHDLFETAAPPRTRNYMNGIDVLAWTNGSGAERSQLVIDQKAGAMVLPWENDPADGIWVFLQETYRAPHSRGGRSVKQLIGEKAFDGLGVWSLEAPAGGLKYENGEPAESPQTAASREATEETGLTFETDTLVDLLPGGLQISGDISTKRSYLFAADINQATYDADSRAVEADEAIGDLLAFHLRTTDDVLKLTELTRLCAGTTASLTLLSLRREVRSRLS